ncbi:Multidrug resistance protein MdtN [Carnimonas sp. R-84981]|uniref:HlyD family secretion protein n=1 Tax=Carnimonas bestiolae TaxID=3402172 RepID=UPI003EDC22FD
MSEESSPHSEDASQANSAEEKSLPRKNPAKKVTIILAIIMLLLISWYVMSDRWAPYSSRGAVDGYITQLAPRVDGNVVDIMVADGQHVVAGQPLFQIDPRPYEIAVSEAESQLKSALQTNSSSVANISASQANVVSAESRLENTRITSQRTFVLVDRGALSRQQGDDARADLRDAEANLSSARAQLRSNIEALGPKGMDNPDVKRAQAQLENAQLNLNYATVRAPTDGVVTNLKLGEGRYAASTQPAMTFIDVRGNWVSADLRENQLGHINQGDSADILFDSIPGKVFKGRVQSIAWGIDAARPTANGLMQSQPEQDWFEPARRMPVRIELDESEMPWPEAARVGGRVNVVVYAGGGKHPIGWLSAGLIRLSSWVSYLY